MICLICLAIPAAMAASDNSQVHGEKGNTTPAKLAEWYSQGILTEDEYNRMVTAIVEAGLNTASSTEEIIEAIIVTATPEVIETQTYEATESATTAPTEAVILKSTEDLSNDEVTASSTDDDTISTTVTTLKSTTTTKAATIEEKEGGTTETMAVQRSIIDQIIEILQGLISG